ncbi:RSC chromatin remodeling complex component [Komagataella phaffii CBS 7435]|uniref:Component of the RSC chromatin remodeling complex n=2 Tax=Komagataella phaffii TaxID=460519 RepID=C4R3G2_KOMPG|nr:Component of the RSC chromatin remodeling complex [Komagataella phaffii GS115]AOA63391.1 GQ67_03079T0 [Komagataella phaffii]CAH2450284.1 RSC chromatin remodeling complex component [Komagataella phaffii CBS 7435]AOA69418.1 GQ68_03063T0 [Komagataella phaffii GS115]CAY69997.1 Component of the RSC chromatin remodeling complex [Komagataella phaffii GS115]CCA40115.1 RSC chromatin remodeling complex component [Komagataella phaffii CBS 7435]
MAPKRKLTSEIGSSNKQQKRKGSTTTKPSKLVDLDVKQESNLKGLTLRQFFTHVLDQLETLTAIEEETGAEYRRIDPYVKLPSKKFFPDYFQLIQVPISLEEIEKKVKANKYKDANQFLEDFELMKNNANFYNDAESTIAKDSVIIWEFVKDLVESYESGSTPDEEDYSEKIGGVIDELLSMKKPKIGKLALPFIESVDRDEYPEYYEVIKEPITFQMIQEFLKEGKYKGGKKGVEKFQNDLTLLFNNARTFNDSKSLIYRNAELLEKKAESEIPLIYKEPEHSSIKLKIKPIKTETEESLSAKKRGRKPKKAKAVTFTEKESKKVVEKSDNEDLEEINEDLDLDNEPSLYQDDFSDEEEQVDETKLIDKNSIVNPLEPSESYRFKYKSSDKNDTAEYPYEEPSIKEVSFSTFRARLINSAFNVHSTDKQMYEYKFPIKELIPNEESPNKREAHFSLSLPSITESFHFDTKLNPDLRTDAKFETKLTVNNEKMNPIPSVSYEDILSSKYEMKLAIGLNLVEFHCTVYSKPGKNDVDSITRLPSRHASDSKGANNVVHEKILIWIHIAQQ